MASAEQKCVVECTAFPHLIEGKAFCSCYLSLVSEISDSHWWPPVSATSSTVQQWFSLHQIVFAPTSYSLSVTSSLHLVRFAIFRPLDVHPANSANINSLQRLSFAWSKANQVALHAVDSAVRYYCQHPNCLFEVNCCHPYLQSGGPLFRYFPEWDPMYCAHTLGFTGRPRTMATFGKLSKCHWYPDALADTILTVSCCF